jgi:hypothetical protein
MLINVYSLNIKKEAEQSITQSEFSLIDNLDNFKESLNEEIVNKAEIENFSIEVY